LTELPNGAIIGFVMSNVVVLHEALSRMLARDLGISVEFVETCGALGLSPAQGKNLVRWFLKCTPSQRFTVMKGVLRDVKATRLRAKRLPLPLPPMPYPSVEGPPAPFVNLEPEPDFTRAGLAASWSRAKRTADVDGALSLNAASYAGKVLDEAGGNVGLALLALVPESGPFMVTVRSYLEGLDDEETSA